MPDQEHPTLARRFRGYLPVIVDVETSGLSPSEHALLEIAAVIPEMDGNGDLQIRETHSTHVKPFPGARMDPAALNFNKIDPYHPFRLAVDEKEALSKIFQPIRAAVKQAECTRAILVGHNPAFDIGFLNAAVARCGIKRNPFHPFSTFDTVTLSGLAYGQTVLAKAVQAAGFEWNNDEAHSAIYDAEQTARLFCAIVNRWKDLVTIEKGSASDLLR
ncbi:ribonuclease T [Methylocaldum marinum]|uniref:Ribonuclease T n=1 Tax=Methylocaldum marinum TaxID=1432792 RepID=A0A250KV39_9GAMM|nr:ribonuclease T [Methylocaldum marinum]BBA35384.1 ribonuclease T [Methylocaldum marinum]